MTTTVSTDSAKRALFDRLIDDAGLFPPANLPMRRALRAHARHRESAYAYVGGSFVVPASLLTELTAVREPDKQLTLSVIMDAAQSSKGDTIRADLDRVTRGKVDGVTVTGFELKPPPGFRTTLERVIAAIAEHAGSEAVALWYEIPYLGEWQRALDGAFAEIAAARQSAPANINVGAKLRCGGLAEGTTPSPEDIGAFLVAARAHDVPWKATAGLHHPVRGMHDGTMMHGFLNLFIAGIALQAGALDAARIGEVVAEEDPRAFVVDPTHIGWQDVRVEAEAVAAARERCVSFGSCSFYEPVDDLRELGILL